jgi:hypothetical protein
VKRHERDRPVGVTVLEWQLGGVGEDAEGVTPRSSQNRRTPAIAARILGLWHVTSGWLAG